MSAWMSVSLKGENVVWWCCTFAGKVTLVTHVRGCRCVPGSDSGHPGRGECEKNFKQTTLSPAAAAAGYRGHLY